MNAYQYKKSKSEIRSQLALLKKMNQGAREYRKEFMKLMELLITVKGHAWCMDLQSERRKMATLLVNIVEDLKE